MKANYAIGYAPITMTYRIEITATITAHDLVHLRPYMTSRDAMLISQTPTELTVAEATQNLAILLAAEERRQRAANAKPVKEDTDGPDQG